jgi:aspartate kinase
MHPRAVELGELYGMPIRVASSFVDAPGTLIHRLPSLGDAQMPMEIRKHVRGIAHDVDVARITLVRVPDRPGIAAAIFQPLSDANISVDTIAQSSGSDGMTDLSFTVTRGSLERAVEITHEIGRRIDAERVEAADDLAKVSIVGTGMQSAPGYASRMFGALADAQINIAIISTSDIRITCVVPRNRAEDAVRILHSAFELDRDD